MWGSDGLVMDRNRLTGQIGIAVAVVMVRGTGRRGRRRLVVVGGRELRVVDIWPVHICGGIGRWPMIPAFGSGDRATIFHGVRSGQ